VYTFLKITTCLLYKRPLHFQILVASFSMSYFGYLVNACDLQHKAACGWWSTRIFFEVKMISIFVRSWSAQDRAHAMRFMCKSHRSVRGQQITQIKCFSSIHMLVQLTTSQGTPSCSPHAEAWQSTIENHLIACNFNGYPLMHATLDDDHSRITRQVRSLAYLIFKVSNMPMHAWCPC
jgi:hypothetical protein